MEDVGLGCPLKCWGKFFSGFEGEGCLRRGSDTNPKGKESWGRGLKNGINHFGWKERSCEEAVSEQCKENRVGRKASDFRQQEPRGPQEVLSCLDWAPRKEVHLGG